MAITTTTISNLLEKIIRPAVEDQFTKKALIWQIARRNFGIVRWSGLDFYIPIRTQRMSGVYGLPENADLIPGEPKYAQAKATAILETATYPVSYTHLTLPTICSV